MWFGTESSLKRSVHMLSCRLEDSSLAWEGRDIEQKGATCSHAVGHECLGKGDTKEELRGSRSICIMRSPQAERGLPTRL